MSLPASNSDHVHDPAGVELHRLNKLYSFPDFVKSASVETLQAGDRPVSVYADPRPGMMLFPCDSPASTWLSALYFTEKKAEYPPKHAGYVQKRLDHFINYWGIKAAVDEMLAQHVELHKNADDSLPDAAFAIVWVGDDGMKQRHYRMCNSLEVKAAADALHRYQDQITFTDRHTIALKVLEKAAQYGANLSDRETFIDRQAGRGICNPSEVVSALTNRSKLASTGQLKQAMENLARLVVNKPAIALNVNTRIKMAAVIDDFDRASHLNGKYCATIPRPEDLLFSVTYKEAQENVGNAVAMTTGNIFDRRQFKKIALSDVRDLFGHTMANAVADGLLVDTEKLADIVSTLPLGDAQSFEDLLTETGIPPIASKAASVNAGFDNAALEKMAAAYR